MAHTDPLTVLIALGLMQHPNIDDRREPGSYTAPKPDPWDAQFVEEKKRLLSHGFVRLYGGTSLSRELGDVRGRQRRRCWQSCWSSRRKPIVGIGSP
ncbi:hypothetical protein, partial [Bradyrhizobium jicamae]|uniref:hypothetical protein n=1 Tax=Bradyrhizobium jicamae TaxID=280332 RepID=UPI000A9D8FA7